MGRSPPYIYSPDYTRVRSSHGGNLGCYTGINLINVYLTTRVEYATQHMKFHILPLKRLDIYVYLFQCGTSILNNTSIGEPDSLNWLENHIKSSQDLDSYVLDNLTRPILDCMHGCHMGRKAGHLNGSVSDVTMSVEEKVSPEQMLDYCKALVVENYDRLSEWI